MTELYLEAARTPGVLALSLTLGLLFNALEERTTELTVCNGC